MRSYLIDGVPVLTDDTIPDDMVPEYVKYGKSRYPNLETMQITSTEGDADSVDLYMTESSRPFERLRRITGYLVGTVDRWNDGKRSELADRVKHDI